MKLFFLAFVAIIALVIVYGSPIAGEKPVADHYYGSPEPILPMSFAHLDHVTESCIECHHNYVDDTGNDRCMYCHVRDAEIWPLLETQFHDLCQGCHTEKAALGEEGGPPRRCSACHLGDDLP
jgi:predicted glycoside hydrolase/deacetylase ChbG (UPF0249 family)